MKKLLFVTIMVIFVFTACGVKVEPTPPDPTKEPKPTKSEEPTEASKPTKSEKPTKEPKPTKSPDPTEEPEPTSSESPTEEPISPSNPDVIEMELFVEGNYYFAPLYDYFSMSEDDVKSFIDLNKLEEGEFITDDLKSYKYDFAGTEYILILKKNGTVAGIRRVYNGDTVEKAKDEIEASPLGSYTEKIYDDDMNVCGYLFEDGYGAYCEVYRVADAGRVSNSQTIVEWRNDYNDGYILGEEDDDNDPLSEDDEILEEIVFRANQNAAEYDEWYVGGETFTITIGSDGTIYLETSVGENALKAWCDIVNIRSGEYKLKGEYDSSELNGSFIGTVQPNGAVKWDYDKKLLSSLRSSRQYLQSILNGKRITREKDD